MSSPPRLVIVGATGWYGKTLIYEYLCAHGEEATRQNLLLFASKQSSLAFNWYGREIAFEVEPLGRAAHRALGDYDGLIWYAFVLKNKIAGLGADAYRAANDSIAHAVFERLDRNSHLRTIFFSSGAALDLPTTPTFSADPYAFLKITYAQELSRRARIVTLYPYATLGGFVADRNAFAASSFIHQALTTGRITIEAPVPIVRSYGSVHDFSRLLLRLYAEKDWDDARVPERIVPVTHTLELNQLAREVAAALGRDISIVSATRMDAAASIYATADFSYGAQLNRFGVSPTSLAQQLKMMAEGMQRP